MCGLYGVVASHCDPYDLLTIYKELRELNRKRASRGEGILTLGSYQLYRTNDHFERLPIKPDVRMFGILGHSRAPTGDNIEDISCVHPFETRDISLAHNGIILNSRELREKYKIEGPPVDSYTIAALMQKAFDESPSIVSRKYLTFRYLPELDGQFACWAFVGGEVYLFRNMSPLYVSGNLGTLQFSSERFSNSFMIKEGIVYQIVHNDLNDVASFPVKRHF